MVQLRTKRMHFASKGEKCGHRRSRKAESSGNYLYFTLLGELYKDISPEKAKENLQRAYSLSKTDYDKNTILKKLKEIEENL